MFYENEQVHKAVYKILIAMLILWVVMIGLIVPSYADSRDPNLLTLETKNKLMLLQSKAKSQGINFKVISTKRTHQEQEDIYAQGRTKPGKIVTWTMKSRHIDGEAFDVAVLDTKGNITWDHKNYLQLGKIGESVGLTWGGSWTKKDYGHFELKRGN